MQPELSIGEPQLMAAIEDARLVFADGRRHVLPTEATQMTYYAARSLLADGRTLGEIMHSKPAPALAVGKSRTEVVRLAEPTPIMPPDEYYFRAGLLIRVEMKIVGRIGRQLTGNVAIEPTAFQSPVLYINELTGERTSYAAAQLPLNTDQVRPGTFYFQLYPLRYYHCAEVVDGLATWELIESFQRAQLIRSTFTQEIAYGAFYIPVSDRAIIQRLERRLADYRAIQTINRPVVSSNTQPALDRPGFRTPALNPAKRVKPRKPRRN